jgi:hypothetical protein
MGHWRFGLDIENKTLVLDLVEWIARKPRTYAEVMDAWRTSCPRLSIWEDAVSYGLVACQPSPGQAMSVNMTAAGRAFLTAEGRDSQR